MSMTTSERRRKKIIVEEVSKELNEWGMTIDLYHHQKNSVLRMEWMEKNRKRNYTNDGLSHVIESNFGILNDKIGSGKTLMCVSFLSREAIRENYETKSSVKTFVNLLYAGGNEIYRSKSEIKMTLTYYPVTVIVVPNSIVFQWKDELDKSSLLFKTVTTNKTIDCLREYVEKVNVIVVTKTLYSQFRNKWKSVVGGDSDYCCKRLIVDEYVARGGFKKLQADFTWLITSTLPQIYEFSPVMVKYNFINYCLKSSGHTTSFLNSYNWKFITIKNTDECINASFIVAQINNLTYICEASADSLISIRAEVSEEIKRMIYADNIRGAIEAYGGNVETDSLLSVIIRKEEADIKKIKASIVYHSSLSAEEKKKESMQKLEIAEKKLENIKAKVERDERENDCTLCCIDMIDKCLVQCCKSIICGKCFSNLLKNNRSCPFCREELSIGNIIMTSKEKQKNPKKQIKLKTKCENIVEIINGNPGGKFLIFSEFYETSVSIQNTLKSLNIKYDEIKGTVQHKKNVLERYRFGDLNVIFLNARVDGSGINLPETTDIILYHKITSPNLEAQIFGRALRLGRTNPLKIHRLLYKHEHHLRDQDSSVNYLHQYNEADSSSRSVQEDESDISLDDPVDTPETRENRELPDLTEQIESDYLLALMLHNGE